MNALAQLPAILGDIRLAHSIFALPFALRHQLGRVAAFSAAVILAVSPSLLYYSRFAREDIYLAGITLAIVVLSFRFVRRPSTVTLALIGPNLGRSMRVFDRNWS